jgi:hypothetical protein
MSVLEFFLYLGLWGSIGIAVFTIFVILVFRTGLVWITRNKDDYSFKRSIPIKGILVMAIIPLSIICLQVLANYLSLKIQNIHLDFLGLFLLNYILYIILFIYDTLIIDFLVLGVWRPAFLKLSDKNRGDTSVKSHILISIPVGIVIGAGLSLISTVISTFLFFY